MKKTGLLPLFACLLLQQFPLNARADILDHWTTNQISTNTFALDNIVYGSKRFVAVGSYYDAAYIYSSPDGLNWNYNAMGYTSWGLRLAYANGQFVGISINGGIATSTNGINWSFNYGVPNQYVTTPINLYGITYGNGMYVVVGDTNGTGFIIISTDGTNWSSASPLSITKNRAHIGSVVYGNGRFVALGDDGNVYAGAPGPFPNTNSYTWTRNSISVTGTVYYNNGLFMVPYAGANLVSIDGINWTPISTSLTNTLGAITYAGGLFMANSGSYLATSMNGTNWFQYAKPIYGVGFATDGIRVTSLDDTNSAPDQFNSFIYTSDALVDVRLTNLILPHITVSGLVGRNYQIQSSGDLNNWCTNAALQLTNTPYVWVDSAATNSQRFYRGVLLP